MYNRLGKRFVLFAVLFALLFECSRTFVFYHATLEFWSQPEIR
jgi:hypothetical protein